MEAFGAVPERSAVRDSAGRPQRQRRGVMHQLVQVPDGVERERTAPPPPWLVSKERRTGVLFLLTFMRR